MRHQCRAPIDTVSASHVSAGISTKTCPAQGVDTSITISCALSLLEPRQDRIPGFVPNCTGLSSLSSCLRLLPKGVDLSCLSLTWCSTMMSEQGSQFLTAASRLLTFGWAQSSCTLHWHLLQFKTESPNHAYICEPHGRQLGVHMPGVAGGHFVISLSLEDKEIRRRPPLSTPVSLRDSVTQVCSEFKILLRPLPEQPRSARTTAQPASNPHR